MQAVLFIVSVILSAIGMSSLHLKTYKTTTGMGKNLKKVLPGLVIGICLAPIIKWPASMIDVIMCGVLGILTAELLLILYLTARSVWKSERAITYYDDGTPPKFFITGDKHRNFDRVKEFCHNMNTKRKDVLIVLGDAGFNYYDDKRDDELKGEVSALNITLFCLHGNKENRPQNVGTYGVRSFCGGRVYYEPKYPNIYFAMDGEIYTFEGKKYMVVGGAHSVDKMRCLEEKKPFWEDEMPDEFTKAKVERVLLEENNEIFGMMTHTCPIHYLPTEMFMSTRQSAVIKRKPRKAKSKKLFKPDIDRSTEEWLGDLETKLHYQVWFCGHYHIDKQLDKVYMMYHEIRPLHMQLFCKE